MKYVLLGVFLLNTISFYRGYAMQRVFLSFCSKPTISLAVNETQFYSLMRYAMQFLEQHGDRMAYTEESGMAAIKIPILGEYAKKFPGVEAIQMRYCIKSFNGTRVIATDSHTMQTYLLNGKLTVNRYEIGKGKEYDVYRIFPKPTGPLFMLRGHGTLGLAETCTLTQGSSAMISSDFVRQYKDVEPKTCTINIIFTTHRDQAVFYEIYKKRFQQLERKYTEQQCLKTVNSTQIIAEMIKYLAGIA